MNSHHNNSAVTKVNAAIGIFDSGVGGLSIAQGIAKQLPNEKLIYVADSQYAPYGEKSVAFIIERVNIIAEQLIKQEVKALVIACNTATVNAIEQLRARVNIPIIGVEPAIKPAVKLTNSKKIAVLVTQATSENLRFQALIKQYQAETQIFIQPCPGLVEMIEQGQQHSRQCQTLLSQYITPLMTQGIDTIVLGCTHYSFLQTQINTLTRSSLNRITLIETATPVAIQLKKILTEHGLCSVSKQQGKKIFYSSSANSQQTQVFSQLWQQKISLQPFQDQVNVSAY